jgi:hypothetical protein
MPQTAARSQPRQQRQGAPPHGSIFALSSPEFVAKAIKAGAKLVLPIFAVPNVDRLAMPMEPGARIGWISPPTSSQGDNGQ